MIAVRVLADGVVVREQIVRELPFTIGRGADCDVVLGDASVSRVHARVSAGEEGGAPVLEDAGSRNGTRIGPRPAGRVSVEHRLRCRLGRVELELEPVAAADTAEMAALEWRRFEQRRSLGHDLGYLALATAGWLLLSVVDPGFWSPWRQDRGLELAGQALGSVAALLLAALLLLVILRAVGRRVRIADTLQALARVVWVWPGLAVLSLLAYYALAPGAHAWIESWSGGLGLAVSAGLLASVRRSGPRWRVALAWGVAVGVAWVALGVTESAQSARQGTPQTRYAVQPPVGGYPGPAVETGVWLDELDATLAAAAKTARERRARGAGGAFP